MNFLDILKTCRADVFTPSVRLVRHADARWDLATLSAQHFHEYQARQARPVFQGVAHIVAFMGEGRTRSRFIGVYCNDGVTPGAFPWPERFPFPAMDPGRFRYDLAKLPEFVSRSWARRSAAGLHPR